MSFEVDEDILQDFLIEADEILVQIQEQLVDLEKNPQDAELLNAIFRGYHTVKGGAGFLALTELVDICHGAENVFDSMRNGQRTLTAELMDVILQATDLLVEMFGRVKAKKPIKAADQTLLDALLRLSKPESLLEIEDSHQLEEQFESQVESPAADDEISEDEFEALLDQIHGGKAFGMASAPKTIQLDEDSESNQDITDDEFEALLDQLHGSNAPNAESKSTEAQPEPTEDIESNDDITDDEFEALLDQIHGSKAPVAGSKSENAQPKPAENVESNQDITDDEFESLLDQLHGEGKFLANTNAVDSTAKTEPQNDDLSDEEFEALLDEIHGTGLGPANIAKPTSAENKTSIPTSNNTKKTEQAANVNDKSGTPSTQPATEPTVQINQENKKSGAALARSETTVRVDTKRLDQIMNMVGELVLVRNRLLSLSENSEDESMAKAITNLDVVTADLQGAVMKTRMQPIKKVFGRFPRVVRDLARTLKKEITLQLEGEETDLDKNLVEALADPLVHLVRNSVDHGIEMPAVRVAAGKPSMGIIKLAASQHGDHILLTIEDDGKGMDAEKLKEIAINRGALDADAAARMTDVEAFNLIFAPGFSTKTEVSDLSGRGVGMDVVKTKINQLNGTVNINSELGKGTSLEIKVPLTLAILPTLMVVVAKQTFALPLGAVNEIINMDMSKTNTVEGQLTMIVRSKAIPLFYLRDWLTKSEGVEDKNSGHVVVVQNGTQRLGFVVDGLIGQEEVVIKPLDALLQGTPGMAGATITSDGGIALILDIPGMLKRYAKKSQPISKRG